MRSTTRTRSVFDEWAADNADVVEFLTAPDFDAEDSRFLTDLAKLVANRRPLTPQQVVAVQRNIARRGNRRSRLAEAAQDTRADGQAPTGRVTVEGTVVAVDIRPGFSADTADYKMTVDCAGDFQVWCTVPQSLVLRPQAGDLGLVGAHVRFAATLTPTPERPSVALGKAPRRVELISPPPSGDPSAARVA